MNTIIDIAFSPDNKILASASADKKAIVWDFVEGKQLRTISDHNREVTGVTFLNNGTLLATAGFDGTIKFWNTKNWQLEKRIEPLGGKIGSIAISPDDKFIAIGTEKRGIQIYEIHTGYIYKSLSIHKSIVSDMQFSADGQYLFSGSLDNTVKITAIESGKQVVELSSYYYFSSLDVTANGQWLAVADVESKVSLYALSELKIQPTKQSLFVSGNPLLNDISIEILEPLVPTDSVFNAPSNKLSIKGKVIAKNGVAELRINNQPVLVSDNGFFQFETSIPLGRWNIPIIAKDFNNKTVEKKLITQRSIKADFEGGLRNGSDLALIIATDRYDELNPLNNPVFDANTIKQELTDTYGFEVKLLLNPTKSEIIEEIRLYNKREFAPADQLLIFVAGHGEYDEIFKQGYLAGRDSKIKDDIKTSYISYADFRDYVNSINCKHIMVVLDVCFGGAFNPIVAARGQTEYEDMERDLFIMNKLKYTSRRYITSGGKQYVSDGVKGNHSPFARKFIEALRNRGGQDGIVTFNELIGYVEKVEPGPTYGEFGINQPGSDFLFISKKQ